MVCRTTGIFSVLPYICFLHIYALVSAYNQHEVVVCTRLPAILVAFNFVDSVSTRLTISHSVSHCVFYSGSAHSHSISHRVQDVAMMSAKCPLNCSAVELWYKIMLEIRNQSELTENHIKRKAAGYQRLSSNWLWLLMATYKPSFPNTKVLKYIL